MTELFGTGFGSYNYVRQRVVDFETVRYLLMASIPAGIAGAFLANQIEPGILRIIFGVVLALLAVIVLYHSTQRGKPPTSHLLEQAAKTTVIQARDGNIYSYRVCNRYIGVPLAGIGAFLTGLMSGRVTGSNNNTAHVALPYSAPCGSGNGHLCSYYNRLFRCRCSRTGRSAGMACCRMVYSGSHHRCPDWPQTVREGAILHC